MSLGFKRLINITATNLLMRNKTMPDVKKVWVSG